MGQSRSKSFLWGAFLGSTVGAAVALLYAPEKGRKIRQKLSKEKEKLSEKTQKLQKKIQQEGGVTKAIDQGVEKIAKTLSRAFPESESSQERTADKPSSSTPRKPRPQAKGAGKKPRYFRGVKS